MNLLLTTAAFPQISVLKEGVRRTKTSTIAPACLRVTLVVGIVDAPQTFVALDTGIPAAEGRDDAYLLAVLGKDDARLSSDADLVADGVVASGLNRGGCREGGEKECGYESDEMHCVIGRIEFAVR